MKTLILSLSFLILTSCASTKENQPIIETSSQIPESQIIEIPYDRQIVNDDQEPVRKCTENDFEVLKKIPESIHMMMFTFYIKTIENNLILKDIVFLQYQYLIEAITPEYYSKEVDELYKDIVKNREASNQLGSDIQDFESVKSNSMACVDEFKKTLTENEQAKYFLYIDDPYLIKPYIAIYSDYDYGMSLSLGNLVLRFNNLARNHKTMSESEQGKEISSLVEDVQKVGIDEYLKYSSENYKKIKSLHDRIEAMFNEPI